MSKTEDEYSLSAGFETIKNSKNNIIFFGSVGTGKTTLL
jgi:DNA replication protein DnaC